MKKIKLSLNMLFGLVSLPFLCVFEPGAAKAILERQERLYSRSFIAKIILSAKVRLSSRKGGRLKINIGCGQGWTHTGWIGIDWKGAYPYPSKEGRKGFNINWDVRRGLPFRDSSVKMIFASHILEHFTYLESVAVLKECHRVLEPGGHIRIVVPNLDLYISKFLLRDTEFFKDAEIAGGGVAREHHRQLSDELLFWPGLQQYLPQIYLQF